MMDFFSRTRLHVYFIYDGLEVEIITYYRFVVNLFTYSESKRGPFHQLFRDNTFGLVKKRQYGICCLLGMSSV